MLRTIPLSFNYLFTFWAVVIPQRVWVQGQLRTLTRQAELAVLGNTRYVISHHLDFLRHSPPNAQVGTSFSYRGEMRINILKHARCSRKMLMETLRVQRREIQTSFPAGICPYSSKQGSLLLIQSFTQITKLLLTWGFKVFPLTKVKYGFSGSRWIGKIVLLHC